MKQKSNLKLLIIVIAILSSLAPVTRSLAWSDKLIQKRIEDKAADTFRLRETNVNVAVQDGYVVLYGTVGLYIQKMLYEQIAWKAKGVVEVDNEIRVVPGLPQTDTAIERKIMELVQNHGTLQGAIHKVMVEDGAVLVHATFENPRDVQFFKHQLAEIEGVISIDIRAKFIA
jgi:osmotically-inducible protein OsmY